MPKSQFDDYSTPTRDQSIVFHLEKSLEYYVGLKKSLIGVDRDLQNFFEEILRVKANPTAVTFESEVCPVDISSSESTGLIEFYMRYRAGLVSSNPYATKAARWGFERFIENSCESYGVK